jgi:carbon monoxide dehydrogenase subunit G
MKLSGEIRVKAPRAKVFEALRDPHFFASCIEGVRDLTEIDSTRYDAMLETKVAYLQFKFKVTVELTRVDPPQALEAKIEGTPLGVVGRLTAASRTTLIDDADGTAIHYDIDTALTGKLGAIGQPVLKSKARQMEKEFCARLTRAFEEAEPVKAE